MRDPVKANSHGPSALLCEKPYRKRRSSAWQPLHPLKILLHRFKTERNLAANKKVLKIELWQSCQKRHLAKSQAFPLEQRQREFCLQLGLRPIANLITLDRERTKEVTRVRSNTG